jgi:hypothetical protein
VRRELQSTASSAATTRVEEFATCAKRCHASVCNCVKRTGVCTYVKHSECLQPASKSRRGCNCVKRTGVCNCVKLEKSLQPHQAQRVFATYGYEYEVKRIGVRTPEMIEIMSFSPLSKNLNENNYRT